MDDTKPNIKAVLFDIGGVLLRTTDPLPRAEINADYGLGPGGIEQLVFNSEHGQAAQLGQLTEGQLWEKVGVQIGQLDNITAVRDKFWAGDSIDLDIVDWLRQLKTETDITTAVISNYADNLIPDLTKYKVLDLFNHVTVSCQEGVLKPNPKIYTDTLSTIEATAQESIFIDDTLVNVQAAQELGITALYFQPDQTLAELKKLVKI